MERKVCTSCKQNRRLDKFPKYRHVCKECWSGRERNRQLCEKNAKVSALLRWPAVLLIVTGVYSHDYVKGVNRVCFYDSIQGSHAITIDAMNTCPMTIQFEV